MPNVPSATYLPQILSIIPRARPWARAPGQPRYGTSLASFQVQLDEGRRLVFAICPNGMIAARAVIPHATASNVLPDSDSTSSDDTLRMRGYIRDELDDKKSKQDDPRFRGIVLPRHYHKPIVHRDIERDIWS